MKIIKLLLSIGILLNSYHVLADSPLTSTTFYKAYDHHPTVKATTRFGTLNNELLTFLSDPAFPLDVKTAIINKLGWDANGKNNAILFFNYLKERLGYQSEVDFIAQGSSDDLLCYAYLKAMDDYFDVKYALHIAEAATVKDPHSFTVRFIVQLINSQTILETPNKWCGIYQDMEKVKNDKALTSDMKPSAIKMVFKYIKGYKKYCR